MPPPDAPRPTRDSPRGPSSESQRRTRDPVATQKRLLDAAEVEFAQRGFAGARLRDIATSAGVQTTLIHHYFSDKQGLYRAVVERALLPTQTESWNLLRRSSGLEAIIRGFVTMLTRFYARHGNLIAIMRHEAMIGSEVMPEILREKLAPVAAAVTKLVADMQSRGEIRGDLAPLEIVVLAVSMAVHPFVDGPLLDIVVPGALPRGEAALAARVDTITDVLLRSLRPASGP